jgi:CheY-like chemotaxis protein
MGGSKRDVIPAAAANRVDTGAVADLQTRVDLLSAKLRVAPTELDVRRPLQAALDLRATQLAGFELEKTIEEVPAILGDEGELTQVFANLLLNAAQSFAADATGPRSIRVMVGVASDLASVRVTVIDNGRGIAPDNLPHVFDPLFTTKAAQGATGLGLFIARGIVQAHDGALDVVSKIGRGTTFTVSLPSIARPARPIAEASTGVRPVLPATGAVSPVPRRRLDVLVVDDEPRFLESLCLALDDQHVVETRERSAEALELVQADPERFDVVLCDLAMPGMDGVTFFERMQELGVGDRFVLMTGGAFTARAMDFVRSGACPSISKPFLLGRLLTLLEDVTQGRRAS